jgi:hypothetical protein
VRNHEYKIPGVTAINVIVNEFKSISRHRKYLLCNTINTTTKGLNPENEKCWGNHFKVWARNNSGLKRI